MNGYARAAHLKVALDAATKAWEQADARRAAVACYGRTDTENYRQLVLEARVAERAMLDAHDSWAETAYDTQ